MPRVTVVIPVYNGEDYLERALRSVVEQTYRDYEILVIDDGSADSSAEIARRFPAEVVTQQNAGIAATRRRAVELARGELIAFLDHDDFWAPAKLAAQAPHFDDPSVAIVYTDRWNEYPDGRRVSHGRDIPSDACFLEHLIPVNLMVTPAVAFRRQTMLDVGNFELDPPLLEDWLGWLKLASRGDIRYVPERLVHVTMRPGSTSEKNLRWYECERKVWDDHVFPNFDAWYARVPEPVRARYLKRAKVQRGLVSSKIGRWLDREGRRSEARTEHLRALREAPLLKGTWYGLLRHLLGR